LYENLIPFVIKNNLYVDLDNNPVDLESIVKNYYEYVELNKSKKSMAGNVNNTLSIIDLFSGCGGMSSGFKKAGYFSLSAVEIDREISNTFKQNHPDTKVFNKDIKEINSTELLAGRNEVDLVVGGPPCQGFSMAGKRIRNNGEFLDDSRNDLFKEFYRVVNDLRPSVFIMENVPGILSMNDGLVKETILNLYQEIGYKTSVKVLLAADYGVPQLRKRAFLLAPI